MAQLKDTLITGDLAVTGNFPSKVFYLDCTQVYDSTTQTTIYKTTDLYTGGDLYNLIETKLNNGYLIVLRVSVESGLSDSSYEYYYLDSSFIYNSNPR